MVSALKSMPCVCVLAAALIFNRLIQNTCQFGGRHRSRQNCTYEWESMKSYANRFSICAVNVAQKYRFAHFYRHTQYSRSVDE